VNKQIAEVLGYKRAMDCSPATAGMLHKPVKWYNPEGEEILDIPDWQHSISDAMGLLEEFAEITIRKRYTNWTLWVPDRGLKYEGEELPEVICCAFLDKAKGE
jgi:hypothetical protein